VGPFFWKRRKGNTAKEHPKCEQKEEGTNPPAPPRKERKVALGWGWGEKKSNVLFQTSRKIILQAGGREKKFAFPRREKEERPPLIFPEKKFLFSSPPELEGEKEGVTFKKRDLSTTQRKEWEFTFIKRNHEEKREDLLRPRKMREAGDY